VSGSHPSESAGAGPVESEPLDITGLLRAARRAADLSQRQLARRAGISASAVGRVESSGRVDAATLVRLLQSCGWQVLVVDDSGMSVAPVEVGWRDRGGRRYPAHLDVRETGAQGDWWGDRWPGVWGVPPRPQHTFHLDRARRDQLRRRAAESGGDAPRPD